MGISRKEIYYWLERASDKELEEVLSKTIGILSTDTDREQIFSAKWLSAKIIEEIGARNETKQA
jgi:hypothetical protein